MRIRIRARMTPDKRKKIDSLIKHLVENRDYLINLSDEDLLDYIKKYGREAV